MGTGIYSATSIYMKLVHCPLMGGLVTFGTAEKGLGGGAARPDQAAPCCANSY